MSLFSVSMSNIFNEMKNKVILNQNYLIFEMILNLLKRDIGTMILDNLKKCLAMQCIVDISIDIGYNQSEKNFNSQCHIILK
jgi:hypothetical protein